MLSVSIQRDGVVILAEKFENLTMCYKNYEFENSKSLIHCTSEKDFYSMYNTSSRMKDFAREQIKSIFNPPTNVATEFTIETPPFDRALEFKIPEYEVQVSDDNQNNRMMVDQQANIIILSGIQSLKDNKGVALVKLFGVSDYHEWCFVMGAALEIQIQCTESMAKLTKSRKPSGARG